MPNKTAQYIIEIITLFHDYEDYLRQLYEEFSKQFPEKREFWLDIASDEARHAHRSEYGSVDIFENLVNSASPTIFNACNGGCPECNPSGFKGRLAIHEMLDITDSIREMIAQQLSVSEIRNQAKNEGMITLKQDGITKVLQGLTTIEEVRAVCNR